MKIKEIIQAADKDAEDKLKTILETLPEAKRKSGRPSNKQKVRYVDCISAFDIETTRIESIDQSAMYIWQWCITVDGKAVIIIGRYWRELIRLWLKILMPTLESRGLRMMVFAHNLSYEFQFLSGVFNFYPDNVFALKARRVLRALFLNQTMELRCSYIQSNMSLAQFTKEMRVEHQKLSGEDFNYSEKRYSWTPLTDKQMEYCINDVVGLCEAIQVRLEMGNDTLYTIPLTSTGYVRRDVKKVVGNYKSYIMDIQPDFHVFQLLRWAFRGGDTHANRYYANRILENVKSADRSSSYPDVAVNCRFPCKRFNVINSPSIEKVMEHMERDRAVLMKVAITVIRLIDDGEGNPYIARHKCQVQGGVFDNGRILSADYIVTVITDIDLKIILDMYEWDDIVVEEAYYSAYGKLPRPLVELFIQYYLDKTELKGVEGQELNYMLSKAKVNSIYGLMAQNPLKGEQKYNSDYETLWEVEENETKEAYDEAIKKAVLPYQWGVWITAWARFRLHEGIKLSGNGFVYADTDSVKYLGKVSWDEYNKERMSASIESGAYATDRKGVVHYMGVYEPDGTYTRFCTMGAKKYAYEENENLGVTISGVNKKKGAKELVRLENFKQGFVFSEAGGIELKYNDHPDIEEIEIDGHKQKITRNVVIKDSTYTLGLTAEYENLLTNCQDKYNEKYWKRD